MHYLIDGHNLIGQMADIDLADPDDEAQLILRLRSWVAAHGRRRVAVYFDGGLPGGRSPHLSGGPLQVHFASAGQAADAILIKRIRRVHNPPEYTLVTNDREIIAEAEARKMPTLTATDFATQLRREKEERLQPEPPEEPLLSDEEVAQWLDLFGPEPEVPPQEKRQPRRRRRPRKRRKTRKKPRAADQLKDSGEKLSADEVEAWFELFTDSEDDF
jgi:predicted RNA-binding protein with PIN domain